MTPLDTAHAAMEAAGDDPAARLRFYDRLADAELCLVLDHAGDDAARPSLFPVEGTDIALAFDTELRMAEFCGDGAHYLQASGRQIAALLAAQGIGLGLNLGAPSAMILPAEALDWLTRTLVGDAPESYSAQPTGVNTPGTLSESLVAALDAKLATMKGLARAAHLVRLDYADRAPVQTLIFEDAIPAAEAAMAAAVAEAVRLSGEDDATLDVLFLPGTHPMMTAVSGQALRFDLPQPARRQGPGTDPDTPPRLR